MAELMSGKNWNLISGILILLIGLANLSFTAGMVSGIANWGMGGITVGMIAAIVAIYIGYVQLQKGL